MMDYGWSYQPERIAAATERLAQDGFQTSFEKDRPALKGYWERCKQRGVTRILAQDDELKVTGKNREPNSQSRGTCVGQGSSRAIEDIHNSRIADHAIVGKPTLIAYEPMYGFERRAHFGATHPWGCRCGRCPDGLTGHDAAAFYSIKGVLRRDNYTSLGIDLSNPREDLAISWNNSGVPDALVAACQFHKIQSQSCDDWNSLADAMAAKCWGHVCLPKIFTGGRIDRFGCCEPDDNGGHCTEVCGVFVLPTHETAFVIQQSWGNAVHYPDSVTTINGPIKLRPGSYAVRQSIMESVGTQVELMACDIPSGSSFR